MGRLATLADYYNQLYAADGGDVEPRYNGGRLASLHSSYPSCSATSSSTRGHLAQRVLLEAGWATNLVGAARQPRVFTAPGTHSGLSRLSGVSGLTGASEASSFFANGFDRRP